MPACHTDRVALTILDREMYSESTAARLLRVAPSTLHWWLEGRPPKYRPVIRPEPTSSRTVTWAEFVEAGLLRSYRRDHEVPLRELRDFIDRLRDEFQVPYPLADRRPYVGNGRRLLIDMQNRSQLDPEFCLVAVGNGQTVLTAPGEEFFERVEWSGDDRPAGGPTRTQPCRSGSIRWCASACRPSAASPRRPSRANSKAELRRGGRRGLRPHPDAVRWAIAMSWPASSVTAGCAGPLLRRCGHPRWAVPGRLRNDFTYPADPGG